MGPFGAGYAEGVADARAQGCEATLGTGASEDQPCKGCVNPGPLPPMIDHHHSKQRGVMMINPQSETRNPKSP